MYANTGRTAGNRKKYHLACRQRRSDDVGEEIIMPLTLASPGEPLIIRRIGGAPEVRQHLETMGFTIGGSITVVATLGGNLTPIGASANITGIGILRKEGFEVKNADFFKIGIPFTLAAIIPAYIYIWLIYGI